MNITVGKNQLDAAETGLQTFFCVNNAMFTAEGKVLYQNIDVSSCFMHKRVIDFDLNFLCKSF